MIPTWFTRGAAALSAALCLAGCGATVDRLEANPSEVKITSADQKPQINLSAKDAAGKDILPVPPVTWASTDDAIVSVDPSGTLTAKATGDARVSAKEAKGKSVEVAVMVSFPDKLVITGGNAPSLAMGTTARATAEVHDAKDRPVEGLSIGWSTSDAAVAAIAEDGTITPVKEGKARVEARAGNLTGGFDLDVVAAGAAAPLAPMQPMKP